MLDLYGGPLRNAPDAAPACDLRHSVRTLADTEVAATFGELVADGGVVLFAFAELIAAPVVVGRAWRSWLRVGRTCLAVSNMGA